jgi:hypothetical protein
MLAPASIRVVIPAEALGIFGFPWGTCTVLDHKYCLDCRCSPSRVLFRSAAVMVTQHDGELWHNAFTARLLDSDATWVGLLSGTLETRSRQY